MSSYSTYVLVIRTLDALTMDLVMVLGSIVVNLLEIEGEAEKVNAVLWSKMDIRATRAIAQCEIGIIGIALVGRLLLYTILAGSAVKAMTWII